VKEEEEEEEEEEFVKRRTSLKALQKTSHSKVEFGPPRCFFCRRRLLSF
jgi:hypothetical protein